MTMGPEASFAIGAMLGAGFVLALRQFYRWLMAEDVLAMAQWQREEAERQAEFEVRVARAAATRERIYAASRLHMEPVKFIPEGSLTFSQQVWRGCLYVPLGDVLHGAEPGHFWNSHHEGPDGLRITPNLRGPRY